MPTFDPYGKGCWICILVGPGWLGPSVDVLTLGFLLLILVMVRVKICETKNCSSVFWSSSLPKLSGALERRLNVLASPVL